MSVSAQRSTKGVLRNLHKLTDALVEENARLQSALNDANAQIAALHAGLELLRRDVAARDRYDGEVRDYVAAIIDDIQRQYLPLPEQTSPSVDAQRSSPVRTALADIHAESQRLPSTTDAQHHSPPSSVDEEAVTSDIPVPQEETAPQTAGQPVEQSAEPPVEQAQQQTGDDSEPELAASSAVQPDVETREAIVLAPQQVQEQPDSDEQSAEPQQAERDLGDSEGSTHELHEPDISAHPSEEPEVARSAHFEHEQLAVQEEVRSSDGEYAAEHSHTGDRSPVGEHEPQIAQTHPELHEDRSHDEAQPTQQEIHSYEDESQPRHVDDVEATRSITAADTTRHAAEITHNEEPKFDDNALDVSQLPSVLLAQQSDALQEHSDAEEAPLASLLDPAAVPMQIAADTEGSEEEHIADKPEHCEESGHTEELHDPTQDTTGEVLHLPPSSKGVSDDLEYLDHSGDTSGLEEQHGDGLTSHQEGEVLQSEEGPSPQVTDPNPYHSPAAPVASSSQNRLRTLFSLPFAADVVQKPDDSPHEIAKKVYEAGSQNYESCSSVFRVIRKKRRSSSNSGDEGEAEVHDIEFVTLRRQTAEVLRWKAREGSDYIDVSNGALAVKPLAAVASRFGTASLNANLRVLEPLRMPACRKDFCYISPEYPDGTSLPYVPVNNVILQHQPRDWVGDEYGVNKVRLSFQKHVFEEVQALATKAYQEQYPGANVICDCQVTPKRVRKVVDMDADAKVDVSVFFGRPMRLGIPEALSLIELDIVGLVLLYIGVDAKNNDGSEAELAFRIHSMVMKRVVNKKKPNK
ncbi:hypothetical protein FGB62_69g264 [Gracilaria domingensis]|nr:hypothetical protein FGB62_69g264 [Gracilaria domingensis]